MFDYLIVGAGFAGSVVAERLAADSGKKVLIIDKRNHIGGNAYDHFDDADIRAHKYGPHIFHTNSREVFEYLSRFTEWRQYQHRVQAWVDGQLLPFPINLNTINRMYGLKFTSLELNEFYESLAEKRAPIKTSEDVIVTKIGRELYEKFFRNYTRKQWPSIRRSWTRPSPRACLCGQIATIVILQISIRPCHGTDSPVSSSRCCCIRTSRYF
jgi:UDP-galactopyranose mutase